MPDIIDKSCLGIISLLSICALLITPVYPYAASRPCVEEAVSLIRFNEQSGRSPSTKAYEDHKGIDTIATGFNLERDDAPDIIEEIAPNVNFNDLIEGKALLTPQQAEKLEQYAIEEAMNIVVDKIGQRHFEKLTTHQQVALISLALHSPSLIGKNLTRHIHNNDFDMVEHEIRHRSNARKHHGIQARREREADVFKHQSALYDNDFRLDDTP